LGSVALPAIGVLVLLGTWQAIVLVGRFDPIVLPSPWAVLHQLGTLLTQATYLHDIAVSTIEFAVGFGIGAFFGVGLGLVRSELPGLNMITYPVVEAFRFVIPFAWIPLVLLWFGVSLWGKILLVAYAVFFVMIVSTSESIYQVNPTLSRVGTVLGMSRMHRAWSVHFRAAAPSIASASRAAAALGWSALIAAEYIGSSAGLGFAIINATTSLDTTVVMATMVTIGIIGASISTIIGYVSSQLLSYVE
jgi:ABC-type nitrate/sulfonate/bicarbonate transport system permease component